MAVDVGCGLQAGCVAVAGGATGQRTLGRGGSGGHGGAAGGGVDGGEAAVSLRL